MFREQITYTADAEIAITTKARWIKGSARINAFPREVNFIDMANTKRTPVETCTG